MSDSALPIAVYYEHPDWFRPVFAELDRRGTDYVRIDARRHQFDPSINEKQFALFFNRMSPSAYLRGARGAVFYTRSLLAHLERLGTRVINGHTAFSYETSKAMQVLLLDRLGLGYPRTRVISHPMEAPRAAADLRFPIVVKANIGGSGAGVVRYDSPASLELAVEAGHLDLGIDGTGLVQEFVPARGGYITRVETMGGKYLYAIKIYTSGESFNLCPADICQTTGGQELLRTACPVDAPRTGLRVEGYAPPAEIISAVEAIAQTAQIDLGGIEYFIDDRDGGVKFYDINCLSNFVADPTRVVGFDPFVRLVDYLEQEANT
jgi:RimK-like ATP-grasp domain